MSIDFKSMCSYWKQFNLPELQKSLDTTANDLAHRQEKCDTSRKKLVELSREFKRTTAEDVRRQVSPLLKSFQQEIDTFSKRSKFAESAFLNLYKKLIEVQDPVPLIENCLAAREHSLRLSDKEQENTQLRETLSEYQREFADIKNQEVTIKNLKEKISQHEDNLDTEINKRIHDIRRDFERANGEKQQSQKDRELSLIKQLGDSERRVTALDKAMEKVQGELFDLKCQFDQNIQAKTDEIDLVLNDVDMANEKTACVERENERLKSKLSECTVAVDNSSSDDAIDNKMASSSSDSATADPVNGDSVTMLRAQLSSKEQELSRLVEELQRLHAEAARVQLSHERAMESMEQQLRNCEHDNRQLKLESEAYQDYDELKRELSVLKSMEFSTNDSAGEEVDGAEGTGGAISVAGSKKTLDALLMGKNRTLQTENTRLKLANVQLTSTPLCTPLNVPLPIEHPSTRDNSPPETPPTTCDSAPVASSNDPRTPLNFANVIGRELASQYSPGCLDNAPLTPATSGGVDTPPPPPLMPPLISSLAQLDTAFIATRVRELLAANNIGQRVFAKYVLGLSQGTISELLSKPKHWDKLTEKGRDSYRKMASWASQDSNVTALRAYSPRKGHHVAPVPKNKDSSGTDERINKILSDAQAAMCSTNIKKEPGNIIENSPHSLISDSTTNRGRKPKTDCQHLNSDIVNRIYREELTKLSQDTEQKQLLIDRFKAENKCNVGYAGSSCGSTSTTGSLDLSACSPSTISTTASSTSSASAAVAAAAVAARLLLNPALSSPHHHHLPGTPLSLPLPLATSLPLPSAGMPNLAGAPAMPANLPALLASAAAASAVFPRVLPEEPQDLSMKHNNNNNNNNNDNADSAISGLSSKGGNANSHEEPRLAASAFTALPSLNPRRPLSSTTEASTAGDDNAALSPLERMQTIANSTSIAAVTSSSPLLACSSSLAQPATTIASAGVTPSSSSSSTTSSGTPSLARSSTNASRTVLPSLRPEHFDRCNDIDTDILVTRIKDALSQYSISQRLFGESVLGLSQGSVSDLLARPKPWNLLTMKGREPFVRMKLFVDDADAVVSLIAKQYKNQIPGHGASHSNNNCKESKDTNDSTNSAMMRRIDQATMASVAVQSVVAAVKNNLNAMAVISPTTPLTRVKEETPSYVATVSPLMHSESSLNDTPMSSQPATPVTSPPLNSSASSRCHSPVLDTLQITGGVKELLQYHNLGQKLFGEVVLGLSQGSVSELLSKPKPWRVLSIKGREPFVKMQTWLHDVDNNIELLRNSQTERKMKRYRPGGLPAGLAMPKTSSGTEYVLDGLPLCPSLAAECSPSAAKKARVFFTRSQKDALHDAYAQEPYPNQLQIDILANTLKVHSKTVVNWFHNHRMRAKQQQHRSPSSTPSSIAQALVTPSLPFTSHAPPTDQSSSSSPPPPPQTGPAAQPPASSSQPDNGSDHSMESCSQNGVSATPDDYSNSTSANSSPTSAMKPIPGGWMFPRFEAVAPSLADAPSHAPPTSSTPTPPPTTITTTATTAAPSEDRVNRRKKARPQRAYETLPTEHVHETDASPSGSEVKYSVGLNEQDSTAPLLTSS